MKDYQLERESELRIEVSNSPVSVLVGINNHDGLVTAIVVRYDC